MRFLLLTFLLALISPAIAQERIVEQRLLSQEAMAELAQGQQISAIAKALQAIGPNPEDIDSASVEAIAALWRAVHARHLVVADDRLVLSAINSAGTRMLVASGEGLLGDLTSRAPIALYDLETGKVIGTPIPAAEADSELMLRQPGLLGFSPDGRFAAVTVMSRDAVILLDGNTGARHAVLEAPSMGGPMGMLIFPIGFSPDSTRYAAGGPMGLTVWDTESGQRLETIPLPFGSGETIQPTAWSGDGFIGLRIGEYGASELVKISASGISTVAGDVGSDAFAAQMSPNGDAIAVIGLAKTELFEPNGNLLGQAPVVGQSVRFVRGGAAIAGSTLQGERNFTDVQLRVFDLSGEETVPLPSDYGGYDHLVHDTGGRIVGGVLPNSQVNFIGEPIGDLKEFYRTAVGLVPDELLAAAPLSGGNHLEDASRLFAQESEAALATGNQEAAIVAALKGLPADPNADDFETFGDAHRALFRAIASRSIRAELAYPAGAAVNSTGTRMVLAAYRANLGAGSVGLVNTEDTTLVAELSVPGTGSVRVHPSNHPPNFSPDGALLAVMPVEGGRMYLFETQSGDYLHSLTMPGASDAPAYGLSDVGFSFDGSRYAAQSDGQVWVFDVETGDLLEQRPVPRGYGAIGWSLDDVIFVAASASGVTENRVFKLVDGVLQPHFVLFDSNGQVDTTATFYEVSRDSGAIRILRQDGVTTTYLPDGQKGAEIRAIDDPVFVRKGTAVAYWTDEGGTEDELRVVDLTGTPLETELMDYVPFDQRVFNAGGTPATFGSPSEAAAIWRGEGVPQGRALYDLAWSRMSDEKKEEISAARVAPE